MLDDQSLVVSYRDWRGEPRGKLKEQGHGDCVDCAACLHVCPTGIDIPTFIHKISTGNTRGAARTILRENLLGASCARVCPVEVLCAGACVFNAWGREPIWIGRLQRFATEITAAWALHLMAGRDAWQAHGWQRMAETYLARLLDPAAEPGLKRGIDPATGALVLGNFGSHLEVATPLAVSGTIRYKKVAMGPLLAEARMDRPAADIIAELEGGSRPEFTVTVELRTEDGTVTGESDFVWTLRPNRR
jgi:ferredoxin